MHGVGCSKYQSKVVDANIHPLIHHLVPTTTLDSPNIHQEVAKKVYVELMNFKKEIFRALPINSLYKYKFPFHYHNTCFLLDCVHFKLYVRE